MFFAPLLVVLVPSLVASDAEGYHHRCAADLPAQASRPAGQQFTSAFLQLMNFG